MYAVPAYKLNTPRKETIDSFRRDLESIRRDLNDLRKSENLTSCLICSHRAITPRIESTFRPYYSSAYNNCFVELPSRSVIHHQIVQTQPEIRSSYDSFWTKNEYNHNYTYRPWTTSRYVP
ncbi:unnamed protein product [Rotaria sp. Silwood1]|nr:unnamed protein product [Rotaria sp. Silwood1]